MKSKIIFRCESCGAQYPRWQGKCTQCGAWDTLAETKDFSTVSKAAAAQFQLLADVDNKKTARLPSGISEFDEVLGGGIVAGSLILLGGDPGIGKSTLALEIAEKSGLKVLYVSGEESLHQLKIRASRIASSENIFAASETGLEAIIAAISSLEPQLVILDSIQTIYSESASGVAGSVAQVSYAMQNIMHLAKGKHISFLIIGHVTKEGYLAGPKTLEHMVDTVLYLEGERFAALRILRSVKNRFGASNEVAVFEMNSKGLFAVKNPSEIFIQETGGKSSGNIATAVMEGSRPILLEIQALTSKTGFGYPKRTVSGYDLNRLQLIAAIIGKRLGVNLSDQDIYVNVVGGMKISDPAADLAVALAIISSVKDKALGNILAIGELGLSGEVRMVANLEKRVREAAKFGFEKIVLPGSKIAAEKEDLLKVKTLKDAARLML